MPMSMAEYRKSRTHDTSKVSSFQAWVGSTMKMHITFQDRAILQREEISQSFRRHFGFVKDTVHSDSRRTYYLLLWERKNNDWHEQVWYDLEHRKWVRNIQTNTLWNQCTLPFSSDYLRFPDSLLDSYLEIGWLIMLVQWMATKHNVWFLLLVLQRYGLSDHTSPASSIVR